MLNITHVITGLDTGGAESMLQRLIERSDRSRFRHSVVSLTTVGTIGAQLREKGTAVAALGMSGGRALTGMLRLAAVLRRHQPDLVKSWLYHADLTASLARFGMQNVPLIWGVHNATLNPGSLRRTTLWTARLCARLSARLPTRIVCDSEEGVAAHVAIGYARDRFTVIPNGFDTDVFRPDAAARSAVRAELNLPGGTPLIGLAARFDPLKDHRNFLEAAAAVRTVRPDAHFVLCGGRGIDTSNAELVRWIGDLGLRDVVHLLGRVEDLPRFIAALDAGVSSSRSESFPLTVGEMMACGVPCVVTDVGASHLIVGDTGTLVPPRDPHALAGGILGLLGLSPAELLRRSAAARTRIVEQFSLHTAVSKYEMLFTELALR